MLRRRGRPIMRTAAIVGTASVVGGSVAHHQQQKYAAQDARPLPPGTGTAVRTAPAAACGGRPDGRADQDGPAPHPRDPHRRGVRGQESPDPGHLRSAPIDAVFARRRGRVNGPRSVSCALSGHVGTALTLRRTPGDGGRNSGLCGHASSAGSPVPTADVDDDVDRAQPVERRERAAAQVRRGRVGDGLARAPVQGRYERSRRAGGEDTQV